GPQTRRGRYSYANGVLLMAWDRFEVRGALHWVQDRRFTLLSDEMLIFDRQPDAGAAPESSLAKGSTGEHPPRTPQETNGPRPPTADQPFEHGPGGYFPSIPVHAAEQPSTDRVLATVLIGAVCVLLLVAIKVRGDRHPTPSTAVRTGEVEKSVPPGP